MFSIGQKYKIKDFVQYNGQIWKVKSLLCCSNIFAILPTMDHFFAPLIVMTSSHCEHREAIPLLWYFLERAKKYPKNSLSPQCSLPIPIILWTTALAPATRKSMSLDHYYHTISDDTHRVGTGGAILVIASIAKQSIMIIYDKTYHGSLLRSAHRDDE